MDLDKIKSQLESEFDSSERKIIFWYDENKEFSDEIGNLNLSNAKSIILDGSNYFKAKYLLEIEYPMDSFLIYAPFCRPKDEENPMLDVVLYSKPFYADYYSLLCEDIGVPMILREKVVKYDDFFKSKARLTAFKKLNSKCITANDFELTMMAVLTKSKIREFTEIFKQILSDDLDDNNYLSDFDRYDLLEVFWKHCNRYFGYVDKDGMPSLRKLIAGIFVTNIYDVSSVSMPEKMNKLILRNISEATVFLTNYKNDISSIERYEEIAKEISSELGIHSMIQMMNIDDIKNNDVFEDFDKVVLEQMILFAKNQSNLERIDEWMSYRENGHYYAKYKNDFECVRNAYYLIDSINRFSHECHSITAKEYVDRYAKIDMFYHLYVYYYSKHLSVELAKLDTLIENKYVNDYLTKINQYWDNYVSECGSYVNLPGKKQNNFYSDYVYPSEEKEKLCVIISDAFRYECGMQLNSYLNSMAKYDSNLGFAYSTIPSYTELGMAALLPNSTIDISDDFLVSVNGQDTNGLQNRLSILKRQYAKNNAVRFDDIKSLPRDELRNVLGGSQILYVYHNQIDARGDHVPSEDEVFIAAQEGVVEIERLMRRLRDETNYSHFIITSDHGFIYRRSKLEESDKIVVPVKNGLQINKRYLYSNTELFEDCMTKWDMSYLGRRNKAFVYTPKGANVFRVSGGGQNYVHGGSSLQEMVIPVLNVKTTARKVEVKLAEINAILSAHPVINSLSYPVKFVQVEPVSDKVLATNYKAYFVTRKGTKISNDCMIYANSKSNDLNDRFSVCKFNLINETYNTREDYFLVIENKAGLEVQRIQFMIDVVSDNY